MSPQEFKALVQRDGKRLFRGMPWREASDDGSFDPYRILVSEVMLQQTQVPRVIPKFNAFMERFSDIESLAQAPLADVLALWSGLGYNRRAKYLHEAAQQLSVSAKPWNYESLVACKGIGHNTAKAVLVYAYNQPQVFIETNIRTVIIHYFFHDSTSVSDVEIEAVLADVIDKKDARLWYWVMMDLGADIKAHAGNIARKSAGYKKQSSFQGSLRQIRGKVLKELLDSPKSEADFSDASDARLSEVLAALEAERLIHREANIYHLGNA